MAERNDMEIFCFVALALNVQIFSTCCWPSLFLWAQTSFVCLPIICKFQISHLQSPILQEDTSEGNISQIQWSW